MTLAAHTNAVGNHTLSDSRIERSDGVVYDYNTGNLEPYHAINAAYTIPIAYSSKPPTYIWGDHVSDYNYNRGVQKVTADDPKITRTSWYNPVDQVTASYDYVSNEFISQDHSPLSYFPGVSAGVRDNMWNEAKTKALNKLMDQKSTIGATLAESRRTVDMFAQRAAQAARFLLALKRGNFRHAWQTIRPDRRSPSKAWLEYSYGWSPLANELSLLQEQVHRTLSQDMVIDAMGSVYKEASSTYPIRDEVQTTQIQHSVRCLLVARLDSPSLAYLNNFGLINPLSIAWEIIPFSFAIDWFMPIGKTLEACTATFGLNFVRGRITEHRSYTLDSRNNTGWRTAWDEVLDGGHYQEQGFGFQRVALTAFPSPAFYADLTPYSTPRALNAIALVHQLKR